MGTAWRLPTSSRLSRPVYSKARRNHEIGSKPMKFRSISRSLLVLMLALLAALTMVVASEGVPHQLFLPVHLLGLTPLLGCIGAVAGDVKLQDDGVVHHPVNRRSGGHGVGKDAFPLGEDQV